MADDSGNQYVDLLAATVARLVGLVSAAVDGARDGTDDQRGASLLDAIEVTLAEILTRAETAVADYKAATDPKDLRTEITRLTKLSRTARRLQEDITPWVDSVGQPPAVGLGTVYLIDEMARAIPKTSADVILTPSQRYMYSAFHNPFESAHASLPETDSPRPVPIVVKYPAREPDSLFLHLIVAHELGHAAVLDSGLIARTVENDANVLETRRLLGQAARALKRASPNLTADDASRHLVPMWTSWLTEILCDSIALRYLGPSYAFTAGAFMLPFAVQSPSNSHPPFNVRTNFTCQLLQRWGWVSLTRATSKNTYAWIENVGALPTLDATEYQTGLEAFVLSLVDAVAATVEEHLRGEEFSVPDYRAVEAYVKDLYRQKILPAQRPPDQSPESLLSGPAISRRAILLAGWWKAFRDRRDAPAALADIPSDVEHQGFVTKGLEMSIVLERWIPLRKLRHQK